MARGQRRANGDAGSSSQNNVPPSEAQRIAAEQEAQRIAAEQEAQRIAAENAANNPMLGLNAVLTLLAQVLERLPPMVNQGGGERNPPEDERMDQRAEEIPAERAPSYLQVLDHMIKLGTKFYSGGSDPIEAEEWRTRVERNFESIRCPDAYKKDIAVHYLESDAHNWWKGVSGGLPANCSWETFCTLFKTKYFPEEAYDRLEAAFYDLRQNDNTVRQYETEFNHLKKYAGRAAEDEASLVRRFRLGLRVELRNGIVGRKYDSVSQLATVVAELEEGIAEKKKLKGGSKLTNTRVQGQGSGGGQNKNWKNKNTSSKPSSGRSACPTCGKMHAGVCRKASGGCFSCGSLAHKIQDCPEKGRGTGNVPKNNGARVCYNCNEPGHFKSECPKLAVTGPVAGQKRPSDGTCVGRNSHNVISSQTPRVEGRK